MNAPQLTSLASPAMATRPPLTVLQATPAKSPGYGLLVVDDEPYVRDVLNIATRQRGFATFLAAGGLEALELYWRYRRTIDVVLMDVRMPGLDGPHTLSALLDLEPHLCCCFMSGDTGPYTQKMIGELGVAAVIRKPFRLD